MNPTHLQPPQTLTGQPQRQSSEVNFFSGLEPSRARRSVLSGMSVPDMRAPRLMHTMGSLLKKLVKREPSKEVRSQLNEWIESAPSEVERKLRKKLAAKKQCFRNAYIDQQGYMTVNGDLNLSCKEVTALPPSLKKVNGNIDFSGCKNLKSLPFSLEEVDGNLDLSGCGDLETLNDSLKKVNGNIDLSGCKNLKSLPSSLEEVDGNLDLSDCVYLETLNDSLKKVNGNLDLFNCQRLYYLPGSLGEVNGNIELFNCHSLGFLGNVGPDALPKQLKVEGDLVISNCQNMKSLLSSLPENLIVGGYLDLSRSDPEFSLPVDVLVQLEMREDIKLVLSPQQQASKVSWDKLPESAQPFDLDELCLISHDALRDLKDPVCITPKNHDKGYLCSLGAFKKWWIEKGTDVISRQPIQFSDIDIDIKKIVVDQPETGDQESTSA